MNVVSWIRVSSKEQRDGYSLDAQRRSIGDYCERLKAKVVREFSVAESAKPGAVRKEFNEMLSWVRQNAKRVSIDGIVFHKLDRACRNMKDAVRLKEIEQESNVKLLFVDQQFGEGAAGLLSFNVLASVSQFYSDNLRQEVFKGMDEKAQQGWLPARPPFGYYNDSEDENEPIKPVPEKQATVARIFELYSSGSMTFETLAKQLKDEGHFYKNSENFGRSNLSAILGNSFYIGEIHWHGRVFKGKHKPLVDVMTFQACQDVLHGRNRRTSVVSPEHPLAGGLFQCKYCGQAITGERILRKLRHGGVREHLYYRCANNHPGPDHPTVRWSAEDLENAIVAELGKLKMPNAEITDWFRTAMTTALLNEAEYRKRTLTAFRKRETELETALDRLLNAHLAGTIDADVFQKKHDEIKIELARVREEMGKEAKFNDDYKEAAVAVFSLTQKATEKWHGSNNSIRREFLEILCLNRELSDLSLCLVWRKPFDYVAEMAKSAIGIPSRI